MKQEVSGITEKSHSASHPLQRKFSFFAFSSYTFLSSINFMTVVRIVYLVAHGYNPFLVGLLETVTYVVQFAAELPTGIFADLVGKRLSLVFFCLFTALQSILFLVPLVPLIALSYCMGGLAWAFRGGTNEALVWQMARTDQPENPTLRYSQLISRITLIAALGSFLGPALGGTFGDVLQILPFLSTAVIRIVSLIPLLFLPEIPLQREHAARSGPIAHLKKGLQIVWRDPILLGLLLIAAFTSACWHVIFFFVQLYLQGFGFSLQNIGFLVAGGTLSYLLFTSFASLTMRLIPTRWLLPLTLLILLLGIFLMCLPWLALSVFGYLVPFQAGGTLLALALSTVINQRTPEAQRVTILSCGTSLFDAAMIVIFPLFGLGIAQVSYSAVYLWTFVVLVVGCSAIAGGTWVRLRRRAGGGQSVLN